MPVIDRHTSQQDSGNWHNALSEFTHGTEQGNTTRVLHYAPVDNRQYHVHPHYEDCGALRKELQDERKRAEALATEKENLTTSLGTANANTEAETAKLTDAKASWKECYDRWEKLQAETVPKHVLIAKLQQDLATAEQVHREQLAEKGKANAAAIAALQSSLYEAKTSIGQRIDSWQKWDAHWKSTNDSLKSASEEKDKTIEEKDRTIEEKDATIEARDAQIVNLTKQRDELEAKIRRRDTTTEAQDARIAILTEQRDKFEAKVGRRDTTLVAMKTDRDFWHNGCVDVKARYDALKLKVAEQESEIEAKTAQINALADEGAMRGVLSMLPRLR
jgi:chromosome segregation ATPase